MIYYIFEDHEAGQLVINGTEWDGHFVDERCPSCGYEHAYLFEYDAAFCAFCNIWLEPSCDSPTCEFCKNRPDQPSQLGKSK